MNAVGANPDWRVASALEALAAMLGNAVSYNSPGRVSLDWTGADLSWVVGMIVFFGVQERSRNCTTKLEPQSVHN